MNESVSDGGDCRTAQATPGLLIITCMICEYIEATSVHGMWLL